jgi:hypothetical protein
MILAVTLLIASAAWTATATAQSLGDLARSEEVRRKAVAPGKVYTNDTLRPSPTTAAPAAAGGTAPPATAVAPGAAQLDSPPSAAPPAAADTVKKDEVYWRTRIKTETDALDRAKVLIEALQSRIDGLQTDFINRDDPAARASIGAERVRALGELDRIKLEIQQRTKAVAEIREEARRTGAPSSWYR